METHKYLHAARVVKRLPWWWEYGELRRAVVVGLEAAPGDLAERDRPQPVGDMTAVRRPVLERDVEYGLDHVAPTTDEADGVAVARPGRAPDDRPGLGTPGTSRSGFPNSSRRCRRSRRCCARVVGR